MATGQTPVNKAIANGEISIVNSEVLNSWKEIATYVGRGVRTVQRWEQELDFPVRRPRGKQRSAVIAFKQDIDLWLRTPHHEGDVEGRFRRVHITPEVHARLLRNTETLLVRTALLRENSDRLQKQVGRALTIAAIKTQSHAMRTQVQHAQEMVAQIIRGDDSTVKTSKAGVAGTSVES